MAVFGPLKLILVRQRLVKDEVLEDCSIVKFKNGVWEILPESVRFEADGSRIPHSPPQEEV